jgi:hypothetical protein
MSVSIVPPYMFRSIPLTIFRGCNKAQQNGFPIKVIQHIKEKEVTKLNKNPTRKNEEETVQTSNKK